MRWRGCLSCRGEALTSWLIVIVWNYVFSVITSKAADFWNDDNKHLPTSAWIIIANMKTNKLHAVGIIVAINFGCLYSRMVSSCVFAFLFFHPLSHDSCFVPCIDKCPIHFGTWSKTFCPVDIDGINAFVICTTPRNPFLIGLIIMLFGKRLKQSSWFTTGAKALLPINM